MQLRKEGNRFFATLDGGIFSNPKGTTAGLVFGAARTRQGKLVTVRRKVDPSNPNTAAQQTQRTKFGDAQFIVRSLGVDIYQSDFNRSIGQLPGFQSMQSIFIKQLDSSFDLALVTNINLGTLPAVSTLAAATGATGEIDMSWANIVTAPATAADIIACLAIATTSANRLLPGGVVAYTGMLRSDLGGAIEGLLSNVEYQIYVYARGAGTAEGLLSVTQIKVATSGA